MKKSNCLLLLLLFPLLCPAQPIKTLFPGDTNNDGICNHYDLLPIGLQYSKLFEPREGATLDWLPQTFPSWPDSLPVSKVNTGFADCDGNGLVDDLDLEALLLNYDSTQAASLPPPTNWLDKLTDTLFSTAIPTLRLSFDKTVAFPGDTLIATLSYSIPPTHPTQALGVAVWLTFPPENVVNTEVRIFADTTGNDLMYVGASSSEVNIWRALPAGNIQFAAAGRGQNDLAGDDILARFQIIIEDKIIALVNPFMLECKEVVLLNAKEQVIPFQFAKDSVMLERRVATENPLAVLAANTVISPNPFSDHFAIDCPERMEEIALTDYAGRLLFQQKNIHRKTIKTHLLSNLPAGDYLLRISTSQGVFVKKLQHF